MCFAYFSKSSLIVYSKYYNFILNKVNDDSQKEIIKGFLEDCLKELNKI